VPSNTHRPTPELRSKVETLTGVGTTQESICEMLGVSLKTLRKHYRSELTNGAAKANAGVAGNLYKMAMGTGPGAVTAMIFWLKTRARWKEVSAVEVSGKEGGPISYVLSPDDARL
jgi:hypothetical protein